MNLSRHLMVSIVLCMSVVLVLGFLLDTSASVDAREEGVQFGVPRESYGVVTETGARDGEIRNTFISSVQAVLRNQPARVVREAEKVKVPEPMSTQSDPVPATTPTESTSTPEVFATSTTTPTTQDDVILPAL